MEKKKKALEQLESAEKSVAKKPTAKKRSTGVKQKNREDNPENANKKETKKISAKSEKKERVQVFEEDPRSRKLIHQIMPYMLMFLSVFILICFLLTRIFTGVSTEHGVGIVGKAISDVLCGLFGFGAFFVPILIGFVAVQWTRAVEKNCLFAKCFYALVTQTAVSTFIHVVYVAIHETLKLEAGIKTFYRAGINLDGGGVIGGYVGGVSRLCLGDVGSVIITVALAVLFFIFLLGLTPSYVATVIKYKIKINRERRAAEREEERERIELEQEERRIAAEAERIRRKEELEREREEQQRLKKIADEEKKAEKEALKKAKEAEMAAKEAEKEAQRIAKEEKEAEEIISIEPEMKPLPVNEPLFIIPPKEEEEPKKIIEEPKHEEKKPEPPKETDDMNEMLKEVFGADGKKKSAPVSKETNAEDRPEQARPATSRSSDEQSEVLSSMKEIDDLESVEDIEDDELEEIPVDIEPEEEVAEYVFPPIDLLAEDTNKKDNDNTEELMRNAQSLMDTLRSFNVKIKEITYSRGPTITRYELKPDVGVRVRSIANLVDDISLNLATTGVRIEAPIPGKPAVGIEVPNANPTTVYLRSLIDTEKFESESSKLTACLGADVGGKSVYFNIAKMPHLLIAGATGMGKSVCINSIIVSLLYKARPDEVKLILIDPKKVEFNSYKDIPHLYCPIVSDPAKAAGALASAVNEMERRFALIEEVGVRNIFNYNEVTKDDPTKEFMPQMVIIIDELADLMMTAKDAVESSICRLAQKARAAGIHIIIGTQRPSVDVITGLIKANIPSRIACTVTSQVDSRTIIDIGGAERLIGKGDMLFAPVGSSKPMRVQGAFVSEFEVEKIVEFIKANNCGAKYNEEFIKLIDEAAAKCTAGKKGGGAPAAGGEVEGGLDPKFKEAVELAIDSGKVATSLLQRRLEIGYGRAAKIIDQMEQMGYVSAPDGNKPRKILISKEDFMQLAINDEI